MSAADQTSEGLSKSAKKRANQKAREAEAAAAAPAAAAPAPTPAAKAQPKAEAAPKAKAKAKAQAEPAASPKAKPKGKAAPAPAAEPAPKAEAKAKAKAAAAPVEASPKLKAKVKAKAKPEEAPKKKVEEEAAVQYEMDDGQGGDWEVASGLNKKQLKRQEKIEEQKKKEEEEKKAAEVAEKSAAKSAKKAEKKGEKAAPAQAAKPAEVAKPAAVAAPVVAVATPAAAAKAAEEEKPKEVDPNVTASIKVPQEKIGRVIGPKGATIALVKEKTGVKTVDTAGDLVTIVGLPAAVALAETAIKDLIAKGYMALAFEDFKEDGVQVNGNDIPNIIGSRGAIIQVIKKECGVEIDIPPVPKDSPKGKKVKVSIAGGAEGVEKAKEIISSICLYQHHEVTHPGFTHAEMEVEEWKYRFLIGPGGSEMRHIQNNFKVRVNIPREGSVSDKVVIIGEEADVARTVKYIEKKLFEAEQPKEKEQKDKADTWGDEAPEEAWMSAYMYKRR